MKHHSFIKLPFKRQCLLVQHSAVPVAERQDNRHSYFLYQLDSFYIEIKTVIDQKEIVDIISFSMNDYLKYYTEGIDITDITNYIS